MNERDVFIAALQFESRAERQAYLVDACGDDEALRRQVGALLETHDRAGNFLQEPVLDFVAAAALQDHPAWAQLAEAAVSQTEPSEDKSPETEDGATKPELPSLGFLTPPQQSDELGRLGHYRVLHLLGAGGMGMVFLADDLRLQRPVALKVMRPELAANLEGRQRFLREARAAALVRSDHVVTIYHVDQEGNLPYLVMEVLSGRSLAEALEQRSRLPLGLCLKIARQTAEGLAAAHASGVIHRDVKPANIWLEAKAACGMRHAESQTAKQSDSQSSQSALVRVKLLDFGLARACTGPLITQRHVILGTPAYMSPEQAAGQPLDTRCDLFSLGAVLYHMLTGRRPFVGDNMMAVLSSLATAPPPPAETLVPGLPAGVVNLLDCLLAKDPAGRPSSAAAVAEALRTLEQEAGVSAPASGERPEPAGAEVTVLLDQRAAPPTRRRWLALAGGLGLAGLAIGLLVLAVALHGRSGTTTPTAPLSPLAGGSRDPTNTPNLAGKGAPAPADVPPVRAFTLAVHPYGQTQAVAFTADSKTLVSADYSGEVTFWDLERREKTFHMLAVPGGQLQSLAMDRQRRWLAVGAIGPDIHLFHFGESVAVKLLKGHTDRVVCLAFLKDGRTLLSAGHDGSIRRWDVDKQKEDKPLQPSGRRIDCLAVWEDGQGGLRLGLAGSADLGGVVSLDGVELERMTATPDKIALSPDGTRLACTAGGNGNGVALWELPGKTRLGLLSEAPFPRALAFTPDSKHVVVTGVADTRIYQTAGGKQVARVDHPEQAVYGSLAVSPDGRWLAVGTLKGGVRVWHLPSLLASSD